MDTHKVMKVHKRLKTLHEIDILNVIFNIKIHKMNGKKVTKLIEAWNYLTVPGNSLESMKYKKLKSIKSPWEKIINFHLTFIFTQINQNKSV